MFTFEDQILQILEHANFNFFLGSKIVLNPLIKFNALEYHNK